MKIKKLTIHGFKSFSERTQFLFPSGTSAVVGPNGCGKSNIVDAIRWVLGEQNARHLRGKVMEDLIFGGSDSRKPLGMAEVTLTLSNEEGNAPARYANFTEIEIQRRLYRSGESEYSINKVPSRLKDIVELFTDTGVGTRAYSIIEQGQVGWLVTAKPDERRVLFEEAAGINKYKTKKEAALRRLDGTRANLTRVNDIISEVKRQLNSLNRQARKAERYSAFKDELKRLDLFVTHKEFTEVKSRSEEVSSRHTALGDKEIDLSGSINSKEASAEESNVEYLKMEEEFKGLRESLFEVERLISAEERGEELARLRIEELGRDGARLTSEIEELRERSKEAEEELGALRDELGSASARLDEQQKRFEQNRARLDETMGRLERTEGEHKKEQAASLETSVRINETRHAIESCLKEEESLKEARARAHAEREELLREIREKEAPLAAIKAEIEKALRSKHNAEAELKMLRDKLDSLERSRAVKTEELKRVKEESASLRARLKTLKEMEANLEGVRDGVKAIMQRSGNGVEGAIERSRIHGLLADVIETTPGYEKAVEAVMGERLHYVIVESQNEGVEAVEYLKTHSSGRGSFLPVHDPRYPDKFKSEVELKPAPEGTRRLLSEVDIKEGYRSVLGQLLSDVLVVDDFNSALAIWSRNGITDTLVTPDGEMIDQNGVITGGCSNGSDGGVLQKRREIKELEVAIGAIERSHQNLSSEIAGIENEIAETKARLESTAARLHSGDLEMVNRESELKIHTEELARATHSAQALDEKLRAVTEALEETGSRKASLSGEQTELDKRLAEKEGLIARLEAESDSLRKLKESLAEEATEIQIELASARQRQEHINATVSSKLASVNEMGARIEAKREELERGSSEVLEKQNKADAHRSALDEMLKRRDEVKREEILKEEELAALAARAKDSAEELKRLRRELEGIQQQKGELSVELKELELSIESLKEKTVERYGTAIESYQPAEDVAGIDEGELRSRVAELREKIGKMGDVSISALEEYNELEGRYNFLIEQQEDLNASVESLQAAITRINRTTREKFKKTFEEINEEFKRNFPRFFRGGKAELRLTEDGDVLDSGIEIVAQPPGKRLQNITLLSGGEKALTATALIFSIFLIKPSPFCLLDEVDAPLDDANIDRFNSFVRQMSEKSQFILITHNKRTMEMVDTLYGITMEEPGVSKTVTVQL